MVLSLCFQWLPILIQVRDKVLPWPLRPMTQPWFLFDLISYCPLCSAHSLHPSCFWSMPYALALGTWLLLFLLNRIFFLQMPVKFIQNSSQVSPFQTSKPPQTTRSKIKCSLLCHSLFPIHVSFFKALTTPWESLHSLICLRLSFQNVSSWRQTLCYIHYCIPSS